ncbi:hypothetical protein WJX77_002543 [Trebouxia sp. C0004]
MSGSQPSNGSQRQSILLAVDDSETSAGAVARFARQHFQSGYEFHVVHVLAHATGGPGPAFAGAAELARDTRDNVSSDEVVESENNMQIVIAPIFDGCKAHVTTAVVEISSDSSGEIGEALIKHANSLQAVMIIMTSHSKNSVKKFFIGSVTDYVVHHSKMPVVVLH